LAGALSLVLRGMISDSATTQASPLHLKQGDEALDRCLGYPISLLLSMVSAPHDCAVSSTVIPTRYMRKRPIEPNRITDCVEHTWNFSESHPPIFWSNASTAVHNNGLNPLRSPATFSCYCSFTRFGSCRTKQLCTLLVLMRTGSYTHLNVSFQNIYRVIASFLRFPNCHVQSLALAGASATGSNGKAGTYQVLTVHLYYIER
jgi:hypothetical protein